MFSALLPAAAQWTLLGPFGGNARALAMDPFDADHILAGAGAGTLYESHDGGQHWTLLAHLGQGRELMVESVVFDATRKGTLYAGGWNLPGNGGGLYVSHDGGRSWQEAALVGRRSVQALVAPGSLPGMVLAGALDGIFRSLDWGESWTRITPEGHADLKNIESLAVDPRDPRILYAGTWHLPWKTTDGGRHWSVMKEGVVDDSDVFSLVVDHGDPRTVYASACSGIYKSEDEGRHFRKIQGIPGKASRTRTLAQHPADGRVVYAGTTAGLWKTADGGKTFRRVTPAESILNEVVIDPRRPQRLLIATDRGGLFRSEDGGGSFTTANEGFAQQPVSALVADERRNALYAAVLNGREYGGVFEWRQGRWTQFGKGLEEIDVFDLALAPEGTLLAATSRGVFALERGQGLWQQRGAIQTLVPRRTGKRTGHAKGRSGERNPSASTQRVRSLVAGKVWLAAGESGLLRSTDRGMHWQRVRTPGEHEFVAVTLQGREAAACGVHSLWLSHDGGAHWQRQPLPRGVARIHAVLLDDGGHLWLASREGLFQRTLPGVWERTGVPVHDVASVRQEAGALVALPATGGTAYVSRDRGHTWQALPAAEMELSAAATLQGVLYLGSRDHGVLAEVRNLPSR